MFSSGYKCCGLRFFFVSFILLAFGPVGLAQAPPPPIANPADSSDSATKEAEVPSFTIKAITQLVTVDVEARDAEDNPVRDLKADDLVLTERIGKNKEVRQQISFFQLMTDDVAKKNEPDGIYLTALVPPTICEGNQGRYELAYYLSADSRKDGFHQIFVKSQRSNLKLYFRRGYKIEAGKAAAVEASDIPDPKLQKQLRIAEHAKGELAKKPGAALAMVACYDILDLASLSINVRKLKVVPNESARYEFVIGSDSLGTVTGSDHHLQLRFAICTFDRDSRPLRYFESTVDETFTDSQYHSTATEGFAHTFEFPAVGAYSARLVVQDLAGTKLGTAELEIFPIPEHEVSIIKDLPPSESFGTTSMSGAALCGDVYNLVPWTTHLPRFSAMKSAGPVYTSSLSVYSWPFTAGIPGVTSHTEWFGINYFGSFWIDEPNDYEFALGADDGAKLYIDEKLVATDDELAGAHAKLHLMPGQHRIRVAYFQGPRTQAALILTVKTPNHGWKLFDIRDFPAPPDSHEHGPKLPLPKL